MSGKVKVSLTLDEPTFARISSYAHAQTRTVQNLFLHAIEQHMRRYPGKRACKPDRADSSRSAAESREGALPVRAEGIPAEAGL